MSCLRFGRLARISLRTSDALRLLALTGARRDEIGHLRWSEIHGNEIILEGARTKNGQPHIIPLSAPSRVIIEGVQRIKDLGVCIHAEWQSASGGMDASEGHDRQERQDCPMGHSRSSTHGGDGTAKAQDAASGNRSRPRSHCRLSCRRGWNLSATRLCG